MKKLSIFNGLKGMGENVKNRVVKRGYYRRDELSKIVLMIVTYFEVTNIEGLNGEPMWETWGKNQMLTKEQIKNLKMATTYMRKFIQDVVDNNLDVKQKVEIAKKTAKYELKVIDDYTVEKLKQRYDVKREVQIDREEMYLMIESVMAFSCRSCDTCRDECKLFDFLDKYDVPVVAEEYEVCNCPYSMPIKKIEF